MSAVSFRFLREQPVTVAGLTYEPFTVLAVVRDEYGDVCDRQTRWFEHGSYDVNLPDNPEECGALLTELDALAESGAIALEKSL